MKTISFYLFILFLLMTNCCKSQNENNNYAAVYGKGVELYHQKNYVQGAKLLEAAFDIAIKNYKGYGEPRYEAAYNAACCWALAGEPDSAFKELFIIAKKGRLTDYNLLTNDSDLKSLHDDKRWKIINDLVKKNIQKSSAHLDTALVAKLKIIRSEDQTYRFQLDTVRSKEARENVLKIVRHKDSINLPQIEAILDKYGWLGPDKIGFFGAQTLFLVIQHAPLNIQEKYLPMMQEAVKKGKALPRDLAFLEDRIALRQGKKQLYGSQLFTDETGTFVQPVEDPDNLDTRRASVWLEPMSEYIGRKWDPEEYKKKLPEIEAKMKIYYKR
jgi:hypothetical protein